MLCDLQEVNSERSRVEIILDQLKIFAPELAWQEATVRRWIDDPQSVSESEAEELLREKIADHYNKRADTLGERHPLGIQVNLTTGVANGVLVVRTIVDCAELIFRILTRSMEFEIESSDSEDNDYLFLRETISGCIFRVMTGDRVLMNSFWNFYLASPEYPY